MWRAASRSELEKLLADDVPHGDLTTEALGIGALEAEMVFTARDPMVLAEAESAAALLKLAGCDEVTLKARSGDWMTLGSAILVAKGSVGVLHRGWKVAQTLIEIWSGVATAARAIVEAATAASPHVVVACTRKNVPGTKSFAVRAIRAGGAVVHRLGLSETVLVFPEHRIFLAGLPLAAAVERLSSAAPEKKLVMEATSIEEALAAAEAGFDVIQAEKFDPDEIAKLVAALGPGRALGPGGASGAGSRRPQIAAAGGINADNAAAYARAGADILVTSSPYLARPRDVQVRIMPAA